MDEKNLKEKISIWFKDRYNLALFLLIIAALIIKIIYLSQVSSQPLWWDEADYMNMAKTWLGYTYWQDFYSRMDVLRPVLFPLVMFSLLGLGLGELSVRILVVLCSLALIPLVFGIGKLFFDKKVALVASLITAVFWSFSFYSFRLLVDIPVAFLWLATIYVFFYAYFNDKNWKWFALAGIFLGLSFLMKFSSAVLVIFLAIYLIFTEKLSVFKNKKIILFYLVSLVTIIPYFIWQWVKFGSPLAFLFKVTSDFVQNRSFMQSAIDQTKFSLSILHWPFLVLFIIGFIFSVFIVFMMYRKLSEKSSTSNKYLFILIWIIASYLFFFKLNYGTYMDERYYFVFYPAIFLLAGLGTIFVYDIFKKDYKIIILIGILALLGFGVYQNMIQADQTIKAKKDSFLQLKLAGEYIKQHTDKNDTILILEEPAEIVYYAERNYSILTYDNNATAVNNDVKKYHAKYVVLSFYYSLGDERNKDGVDYILKNSNIFIPVQAYGPYINQEQTLPLAIVFEVNPSAI